MDAFVNFFKALFSCCTCKVNCNSACCTSEAGIDCDFIYEKQQQNIDTDIKCMECFIKRSLHNQIYPKTPPASIPPKLPTSQSGN
jgi:hypothetical protein